MNLLKNPQSRVFLYSYAKNDGVYNHETLEYKTLLLPKSYERGFANLSGFCNKYKGMYNLSNIFQAPGDF